jgi:uncharacterized RDD family membrane protein YckC
MTFGSGRSLAALLVVAGLAMTEERHRPRPLSWLATKGVEVVDIDDVLSTIDIDAVLERVDINALAQRVDLDALLAEVDLQAMLERVDLNVLLTDVDLNALLAEVDLDALLASVDINALLDRVDPNPILDRVDPDRLLDRVDPDRLLDRVDPNRLLDRVDPDRLLDRVDVDRLMDRVDVPAIVERAGIAEIVQESTGAVAGSVLDVARRTLVGVDAIIERTAYRLIGKDPATRPTGPRELDGMRRISEGRADVTGRYAGPVSRVAAFGIDMAVVFWVFTLSTAALAWIASSIGVSPPEWAQSVWFGLILFWLWAFLYWWMGLGLTGRTVGKGVLGLRVVQDDGDPITGREAVVRTLVMPLSFATLLFGIIVVLFSPRRRTLHDWAAHTCEVYDWGDRPAELPAPLTAWVARRTAGTDEGGGEAQ